MIVAVPACGMTPGAELLAARETFNATVQAVTILRAGGAFTETQGERLETAVNMTRLALAAWQASNEPMARASYYRMMAQCLVMQRQGAKYLESRADNSGG